MIRFVRPAVVLLLALTLITGVAYPLLVTVVAQSLFADQANGSLLRGPTGEVRGSRLLAQPLNGPQWFQSRPSAADYASVPSGASNLSAGNPALRQRIEAAIDQGSVAPLPMALATTSASGLDPHLPPAAALYQVSRIAAARHMAPAQLEALVEAHTERPWFGPAVVNVLALNEALAHNPPTLR